MIQILALCLLAYPAPVRSAAWPAKHNQPAPGKAGHRSRRGSIVSPDSRHVATIERHGVVRVDGRRLSCGIGTLHGRPAWRADGGALALLHRTPLGVRLCVVLTERRAKPLTYWLTRPAEALRAVFWVGPRRVGIGRHVPVPRVIFSWTDELL